MRYFQSQQTYPLFLLVSATSSCFACLGPMTTTIADGKYRLGRELGSGSFGTIYLGEFLTEIGVKEWGRI